jgi:uncharacterized protein YjiS (DUF1127 family)
MITNFRGTIAQYREQARKRGDYQTMMMQDDRFFRDIGLSRSDAYDAVFKGRRRD